MDAPEAGPRPARREWPRSAAAWRRQVAPSWRALRDWPWRDTVRTLRQRFREDHLGLTAGSLTFTTLISLVPLATVMLALFSAFPMFASFESALEGYFLRALVPASIAQPVLGAVREFAHNANRLGSVGLVILLATALALMLTIDRTLNAIWRVRRPRPIAQRVLVYWSAATLGPLVLGVSLSLTSYALSVSGGVVQAMPGSVEALLAALEFVLFAVTVAGLFHYVPNTHVRWRHALAGGIVVATGFEVARRVLGWYLRQVPSYAMVYGAFATVPILLVWVYASWGIVLMGAVIAACAPSLSLRVTRRSNGAGHHFALAVAVLGLLNQARRVRPPAGGPAHGLAGSALAAALRCDPLQLEPVLDALVEIDWVGRLSEAGGARHVLLCDPASTPAAPLLRRLLLEPSADTAAFSRQAGFDRLRLQDLIAAEPPGPGSSG